MLRPFGVRVRTGLAFDIHSATSTPKRAWKTAVGCESSVRCIEAVEHEHARRPAASPTVSR